MYFGTAFFKVPYLSHVTIRETTALKARIVVLCTLVKDIKQNLFLIKCMSDCNLVIGSPSWHEDYSMSTQVSVTQERTHNTSPFWGRIFAAGHKLCSASEDPIVCLHVSVYEHYH